MKTKILATLTLALAASVSVAQNEDDAIRYSNIVPLGTAKFISMGGAMGAIGGDETAVTINPAGIGVYRNNHLSISPMWTYDKTAAKYYGTNTFANTGSFKCSNVGIISSLPTNSDGLESVSFGFTYNRLANFDGGYTAKGYNDVSSMLDKEVDDFNADVWSGNVFLKSDLFIYDSAAHKYFNDYENIGNIYGSEQRKNVSQSGSLSEYSFLLGANINNNWYLGGSLNIVRVNYKQSSKYTEIPDLEAVGNDFAIDNFVVSDEFWTEGGGVNLKLGVIGWLNDNLRVGAAFHSPTILSLTDDYGTSVESAVWYTDSEGEFINTQKNGQTGLVDWRMTLPAKYIGSFAFVAPEHGMIDVDCEIINYKSTYLDDDSDYVGNEFDDLNSRISEIYRTAVNVRVGSEILLGPAVARAGFGFYGSPYKSGYANSSANKLAYSVGLGYRSQHASIDFGYSLTTQKRTAYLYSYETSETSLKCKQSNIVLTLGFRF